MKKKDLISHNNIPTGSPFRVEVKALHKAVEELVSNIDLHENTHFEKSSMNISNIVRSNTNSSDQDQASTYHRRDKTTKNIELDVIFMNKSPGNRLDSKVTRPAMHKRVNSLRPINTKKDQLKEKGSIQKSSLSPYPEKSELSDIKHKQHEIHISEIEEDSFIHQQEQENNDIMNYIISLINENDSTQRFNKNEEVCIMIHN